MWCTQLTLAVNVTQASMRSDFNVSFQSMEVAHDKRPNDKAEAERRAVILELWHELGEPPIDARLLKTIESRLVAAFGNHETHGPAAIARVLADQGADLKHPEIIETDAAWRQARIETNASETGFQQLSAPEVLTLATAEKFIDELEVLRKRHELNEDRRALAKLRTCASEARRLAESIARNRSGEQTARAEQAEIAEWLKVWLQTPALFKDWLELRKRSDEFRRQFKTEDSHRDTETQSKNS